MKHKLMMAFAISSIALSGCGEYKKSSDSTPAVSEISELSTPIQKVSYVIGLNMGQSLKNDEIEVDLAALTQALEDTSSGHDPRLSQEDMQQTMSEFQNRLQAKRAESIARIADENAKAGAAFLVENGTKEGVVATESGLQYKVINAGDGAKPGAEDKVSVHYRGTLLDGTEFDSSYKRGEPVSFPVNGVIPAWTEALQLMSEGSKWELYVPADLAYGPSGAGANIGPNATLIFEVELLQAMVE